jgi:hypothetical protein
MSNPTLTPEQRQFVEAIYGAAAHQMRAGIARDAIVKSLMDRGLDAQSAHTVISNLTKGQREAAQRNMLIGALFCAGGTAVTVLTYQAAASSPGGGRYLLAWGAILFGAIQFFRGLFQMSGPS